LLVLQFLRHGLCCSDVPVRCSLVAVDQEHDQFRAALNEIDSIAWAIIDAQFADSFADRLDVAEQSSLQPGNAALGVLIPEIGKSVFENISLADRQHM
jgi:hypothetical protein